MGKRVVALYSVLILLFTGTIFRVYYVAQGDYLSQAADSQSTYTLDVAKSRGLIYDDELRPLVSTREQYIAAVMPCAESSATIAAALLKNDPDAQIMTEQPTRPYTLAVPSPDIYSKGVEVFTVPKRYDENQLAPHLIGYLDAESENGIAGIEMAYNDKLKEYDGAIRVRYFMDALGNPMQNAATEIMRDEFGQKGGVVLTLDRDIQTAARDAAKKYIEKGAVVVMDVKTGDIKASASMPEYDPNDLTESLKDPNSPFVNRAFSPYSVGSTFKLAVAAAALEQGCNPAETYNCEGYIDVDGVIFYCHYRNGHGEIDLSKAIEISCNPFFIHMSQEYGVSNVLWMAREMGFSKGYELAPSIKIQSGTLPDEKELTNPAAAANFSFGQGVLTATPTQVAQMISCVANGGYSVTPRLVEGFTEDGKTIAEHTTVYARNRPMSQKTSNTLRADMVTNVTQGSGKKAKPAYFGAGGKTASAQTGQMNEDDVEIVHAWFAGYIPDDDPEYAIVVLIEGGDSGSDTAAPVFKAVADGIAISKM